MNLLFLIIFNHLIIGLHIVQQIANFDSKGLFRQKIAIIIIISSLDYTPPRGSAKCLSKTKRCLSKTQKNIVKFWTKMSIKVTIF